MMPGVGVLDDLAEWVSSFPLENTKPVDRLAASLFVNSANPGVRLMAMFTAYFDASGNALDQPFVVVSGYIANYIQWKLFENMWKKVHDDNGVNLPFHMASLIEATKNPLSYANQKNARPDYISLGKDPKRAQAFFLNLSIAEATVVDCAVTGIVPMDVYNGVSSLLDLRKVVPPYALAARMCIDLIGKWEETFDVRDPVECIFEEGDFEQGKFTDLMVSEGRGVPIYKGKNEFAGLQGADHYAWERAYLRKSFLRSDMPPRASMTLVLNAIPKLHIEATVETLINVCHMKDIDPRTGVKHDK